MINFLLLSEKIKQEGYGEDNIEAKLCQDLLLLLLSKSRFNRNITIKGGVVMRSISNDVRRTTIDLDLDLIKYPLTISGIRDLVKELNGIDDIKIRIIGKIEELKHQDYVGKRLFIEMEDSFGNYLSGKIDVGVHKYLSLEQIEYCFDISASERGVSLLINSKEQMFTEKLKSLLRLGALSTRFKDVFDMYYLSKNVDLKELKTCFKTLIYDDPTIRENNILDVINLIQKTFNHPGYLANLNTSKKNWLDIPNDVVLREILDFLKNVD